MSPADPYARTDKLDDAVLDAVVTRLESRGKYPPFQGMLTEYLDIMQVDSARSVLDMGCGTGVASRALLRRSAFTGSVTGIDLSPYLVEVADRLAREEGFGGRVAFRAGDTRSLDLPTAGFDAVIAHTLVSHVDDPVAVIKEAARVVRPGGLVGIFDGDYASVTFGHPDAAQAKVADEAIINAMITSPRVMRQMPRLLRSAGLLLVASRSYVLAEIGKADFWLSCIASLRRLIPVAGTMSESAANALADGLLQASDEGVFFGASNYYSYVAKRPHDSR
jgi:ubiquinone/menaquinone biosynthesis C-methylase UbiE